MTWVAPNVDLDFNNQATRIGSKSLAFITPISGNGELPTTITWQKFPTIIKEVFDVEPKSGEIIDDDGQVIYSYSKPSKGKFSGVIIQRDAKTLKFLREHSNTNFLMWVVVGQVGEAYQEWLLFGKFGGKYKENMEGNPEIPIEFNCEVNQVAITVDAPNSVDCYATSITLPARDMFIKNDTGIS
jgi:hypothetical protein